MANIILNKLPMDKQGSCLLNCETQSRIHNMIYKTLNEKCPEDNYIVFTTPTDLSVVDGNAKIIKIDAKEYSSNELLEIIEKANMYDGLRK
jgi:hypothetical protein